MTTPTDDLPFADLVRARMAERGMGLRELCRAVGVDPSYFSKVLAHKRNPPSEEEVLEAIARELDMDAPRLIVSAGRIPRQWRRIWSDSGLFHKVHGLLAVAAKQSDGSMGTSLGKEAAASKSLCARKPVPRSRGWGRPPSAPYVRKDLEEELL